MQKKIITDEKRKMFIERIKQRKEIENEVKKDILTNSCYIKWLIRFIKNFQFGFSDYDVVLDEFDNQNIQKLSILYSIIEEYVMNNYIYKFMKEEIYYVRYNDVILGFEKTLYQGGYRYSVIKYIPNEKIDYIDFKDICENRKDNNTDKNDLLFNKLSEEIDMLYQNGLPIEYIKNIIDKILNSKIEQERKVYKKKYEDSFRK